MTFFLMMIYRRIFAYASLYSIVNKNICIFYLVRYTKHTPLFLLEMRQKNLMHTVRIEPFGFASTSYIGPEMHSIFG